jgi:hypothetical protein
MHSRSTWLSSSNVLAIWADGENNLTAIHDPVDQDFRKFVFVRARPFFDFKVLCKLDEKFIVSSET